MLSPIGKQAQKVMDILTEGLDGCKSKKIDNAKGSFMAVHVENIGKNYYGPLYSVTHYYEQNGDLMSDPDMVFIKGSLGHYFPISYQQDGLGLYQEVIAETDENGRISKYRPKLSKDLASFANMWMRNIKQQQRL